MQFLARSLARWPIALACVVVLAAAALLPGLGGFGLWEPQERQLADRVAPRDDLAKPPAIPPPPATARAVPVDTCAHQAPKDAVARSLTNRAVVWGRDHVEDSDAGRRLPLALLGLLTVLAASGIAMRTAGARAGVVTGIVLLSMPLLALQSRQLTSEIGTPAGAALIVYGLVALGVPRSLLGVLDMLASIVAIAGGVAIGFASGGALLGVLVPVGSYAAASALGGVDATAGGPGGPNRVPRSLTIDGAIQIPVLAAFVVAFYLIRGFGSYLETFAMAVVAVITSRGLAVLVHRRRSAPPDSTATGGSQLFEQMKVVVAMLAAFAVIGWLAYQLYDLREPQPWLTPPQRALLGKAIVPNGCWSSALGAMWRADDDLRYVFDSTFEQIAYGTFPWGVLAPIAFAALLASKDFGRRRLGALTLAWAGCAWIAAEVYQRKVGFALWAGFPAIAIAVGAWLDAMFAGRARGEPDAMPSGAKLIGLYFLLAVVVLAKDMQSFSEKLSSLLVGGDGVPYPTMSHVALVPTRLWVLVIGGLVGLGFALTMIVATPVRDRAPRWIRAIARYPLELALAGTIAFVAFWPFAWQPALAEHLSSKAMFDSFEELRKPGDALVLMGDLGDAPHDYAPDVKPEVMPARDKLVEALGRPNRVFAIAPQAELCQLHREIGGKPYFVIDDRNTKSLLLSNRVDGTTDKNPLRDVIVHAEPKDIPIRPKGKIVWDSRIQLLGWDMPKTVARGAKFEIKMYYKVLQAVGGTWKVLFHFDGPLRFNGDHDPINNRCATSTWQKDDYIIDTYSLIAGGGAFTTGAYEVWTGFFTGSAPNWKNMPISEAPGDQRDGTDRVKITTITLD